LLNWTIFITKLLFFLFWIVESHMVCFHTFLLYSVDLSLPVQLRVLSSAEIFWWLQMWTVSVAERKQLSRKCNTKVVYKKGPSRLLLRHSSLEVHSKMLQIFCKSVEESTLFFAAIYFGLSEPDTKKKTESTNRDSWLCLGRLLWLPRSE